ncbi:MAG: hypothetical protein RML46_01970 [Anaerolineae bacterium]|nr:hypothetical protein [Anaerolineae bacterium]MDW8067662.1 hypothetical protein [Anaerolineae bacterium]
MDRFVRRALPTSVAIGTGILVLLGYLFPHTVLASVRDELIHWGVIIAAFAFILGFFNLLRVHLARARTSGGIYSLFLILAALASLGLTLAALLLPPLRFWGDWWFRSIIAPLQATVMGLVAFVLAVAAVRLLRHRRQWEALVFLVAVLVVLMGTLPLPLPFSGWLEELRHWWIQVPAMAGMRGLLIGVGLGALVVGLRILVGADRPYTD